MIKFWKLYTGLGLIALPCQAVNSRIYDHDPQDCALYQASTSLTSNHDFADFAHHVTITMMGYVQNNISNAVKQLLPKSLQNYLEDDQQVTILPETINNIFLNQKLSLSAKYAQLALDIFHSYFDDDGYNKAAIVADLYYQAAKSSESEFQAWQDQVIICAFDAADHYTSIAYYYYWGSYREPSLKMKTQIIRKLYQISHLYHLKIAPLLNQEQTQHFNPFYIKLKSYIDDNLSLSRFI